MNIVADNEQECLRRAQTLDERMPKLAVCVSFWRLFAKETTGYVISSFILATIREEFLYLRDHAFQTVDPFNDIAR